MAALEMNPEIRAQWAAALRSGEYPQGTKTLRSENGFCCLGVLCALAEQEGAVTGRQEDTGWWTYDGINDLLPTSVQEWAALDYANPRVITRIDGSEEEADLAALNDDHGWTFAQIADAIEGIEATP